MSAGILQEFMIKLGYHVDEASGKRLSHSLSAINKSVLSVGSNVAGLAIAAGEAVREFATQMERVGYIAKLADSTAQSIGTAGMAVEKFGLQAGQIEGITTAFAGLIRRAPGVEAQLSQLGVALGPDKIKEFWSLMQKLESMPEFVALQYAQAFQIPADAYHLMRGHVSEIMANMKVIADQQKAVNYDAEGAAKRGQEFSNHVRDIKNDVGTISSTVLDKGLKAALPVVEGMAQTLHGALMSQDQLTKASAKEAEDIEASRARAAAPKEPAKPAIAEVGRNNPGRLRFDAAAKRLGATGADAQGYAVFPTWSVGQQAAAAYEKGGARRAGQRIEPPKPAELSKGAAAAQAAIKAPPATQAPVISSSVTQNFYGPVTEPAKVKSAAEEGVKRGLSIGGQKAAARSLTGNGPTGANHS